MFAVLARATEPVMQILLVIDGMHPRDGGPPMVVAGSAHELKKQGQDVTILTTVEDGEQETVLDIWQSLIQAGVTILFCDPVGAKDLLPWRRDSALVEQLVAKSDVVHLHGLWNPILIQTARIAQKHEVPYLFSTHGVLDHRAMHRTHFKLIKKHVAVSLLNLKSLLSDSAGIIFGSAAEAAQSWEIASDAAKFFVPNGVAYNPQTVSLEQKDRLRQIAPSFDHWSRRLLYFARIHPEKGADMLVEAFNIVAKEFPGAGLLIAGLKQDAGFQHKLEALISKTPDPTRLVFTTALTGAESQFLYRMCDCYVLPSHAEGFSVALTEALANGCPSLITRYCHMPIVEEQGGGIVVDPTVDALVAGLRKILTLSDDDLRKMGRNASALFQDNYTWSKVAALLVKTYQRAAEKKKELSA